MDANQVGQAFRAIQHYRGTPCRPCQSRKTEPTIYMGVVFVSCEDCGGATPVGRLAELATPPPLHARS